MEILQKSELTKWYHFFRYGSKKTLVLSSLNFATATLILCVVLAQRHYFCKHCGTPIFCEKCTPPPPSIGKFMAASLRYNLRIFLVKNFYIDSKILSNHYFHENNMFLQNFLVFVRIYNCFRLVHRNSIWSNVCPDQKRNKNISMCILCRLQNLDSV